MMRRLVRHKRADDTIRENPRQNKVMPSSRPASRRLVLASTSRYRRELLQRLALPFEAVAPQFDEAALPGEPAAATALRLSVGKAQSLTRRFPDSLIIGSDQVASTGDARLGKPGDHATAVRQLRALSGKSAQFDTAVTLLDTAQGKLESRVVGCRVTFRILDEGLIERYLRKEQPYDCAGSAKSEGLGIALIERIETDDPTSLVGLPLIALTGMLARAGVPVL
jgi:septum formation protein